MRVVVASLLLVWVSLALGQRQAAGEAQTCNANVCKLPDCYCGGTEIPGGFKPEQIPQFVLLTFDDAVNGLNHDFFGKLFKGRFNPNECPIKVR